MTAELSTGVVAVATADRPRALVTRPGSSDRLFRGVARGSGAAVVTIMSLVGIFLAVRAWPAVQQAGLSFLTTAAWQPDAGNFGIAAVFVGTVLIATVAIAVAFPLAVAAALYIAEYAPARTQRTLISLVDLMAAVPSVVYGLWGFFLLQGQVLGLARWLSTWFGFVPGFEVRGADPDDPLATATVYTSSTFIAGLVVGIMVAPLACSVMREVFSRAPVGEREGALALGSTRWGMIRAVVLPYAKGGMIGGTMLSLGRALGETIVVFLIISPVFVVQPRIFENGTSSISSLIALQYGAATPFGTAALMAAGLTLFLVTLVVNFGASSIVARSRSGAESDA